MTNRTVIRLLAGRKSDGTAVFEEVLVDELSPGVYEIIATPGMVLGIASGDIVSTDESGEYEVVRRGGNLAVHIYGDNCLVDNHLRDLNHISPKVDGRAPNLTVLTIPLNKGFENIESTLESFCRSHHGLRWYYANVYDPIDGVSPLNWWLRES